MDTRHTTGETADMNTHTRHALMDEAERLALEAFGESAEMEHIEAVYERLELHWRWGLPADGAVTIH